MAQVTDAVGQAVGQLYATFQSQTQPTDYGPEYQEALAAHQQAQICLLYTSPSPRDRTRSRMPSSA